MTLQILHVCVGGHCDMAGSKADRERERMYAKIEHFCYPNTAQKPRAAMRPGTSKTTCVCIQPVFRQGVACPETFTFVLTDTAGGRRIGFCRRSLPAGSGPRYPEVLCIIRYS
jgi:hypothetical protein